MPAVSQDELLGFQKEEMITISAKRWQGVRRQLVRLVIGFRYADKEISRILEACRHAEGCPAVEDRARPCLPSCPDREIHLSALVIKHNAEQYALLHRGLPLRPDGEYSPPSRETFDAIVAELEVLREGQDILSRLENLADAGKVPSPWADTTIVTTAGLPPSGRPVSKLIPVGEEDGPPESPDEGADGEDPEIADTDRPPAADGVFDPAADSPDHRLIKDHRQ